MTISYSQVIHTPACGYVDNFDLSTFVLNKHDK